MERIHGSSSRIALPMCLRSAALRDPLLVITFDGVTGRTPGAVAGLLDQYEPQPLAEIDQDEFYDFSTARPLTRLVDGARTLEWPSLRLSRVALDGRALLLFGGIEPSLRWRRLSGLVQHLARAAGVREVLVLSAFNGAVPHTRPTPLHWLALSEGVSARFGLRPRKPSYQGPATFTMALGVALRDAGFSVGGLTTIASFYIGVDPSPPRDARPRAGTGARAGPAPQPR